MNGAQELTGERLETEPLGTSYIDDPVDWGSQRDIGQRRRSVIREDRLDERSGRANRSTVGRELSDDLRDELEELRGAEDGMGNSADWINFS